MAGSDEDTYYFWGALAFHRLSSFGAFPEPPLTGLLRPENRAHEHPREPSALAPARRLTLPVGEALVYRESKRAYGTQALKQEDVLTLLWAGNGHTFEDPRIHHRTAPSPGMTYGVHLTLLSRNIDGLTAGVYRYQPAGELARHDAARFELPLEDYFHTHHVDYGSVAAVIFLWGQLDVVAARYGERGYRYLLLEAGHIAQNIGLAAASLGIMQCPIGGIDDGRVARALALTDERELALYAIALGQGL